MKIFYFIITIIMNELWAQQSNVINQVIQIVDEKNDYQGVEQLYEILRILSEENFEKKDDIEINLKVIPELVSNIDRVLSTKNDLVVYLKKFDAITYEALSDEQKSTYQTLLWSALRWNNIL